MQKSIEDRMERMELKIDMQHRAMESSVEALHTSLERRADESREDRVITRVDLRCDIVEKRLEKIAHAVGIKHVVNAGDDEEDRKRLKMRLKEALSIQNAHDRVHLNEPEGFFEYFLGIRPPNGRVGKQGSRCGWGFARGGVRFATVSNKTKVCWTVADQSTRVQAHSPTLKVHARCAFPHRTPATRE
jgi:hypothetical protein